MPKSPASFVFPSTYARPLPSIVPQQRSNSNAQIPASGSSQDLGGAAASNASIATIIDTHLLTMPLSGISSCDGTAAVIGKVAHVAAFSSGTAEIQLFFHGSEQVSQLLIWTQMLQVQDYPPMFVPADVTKWTVYRNIVIHDRFFVPILFNLTAVAIATWRLHYVITDHVI